MLVNMRLVESLKELRASLRRDAQPVVPYREAYRWRLRPQVREVDLDVPTVGAEPDGIVEQVGHHLPEPDSVHGHLKAGWSAYADRVLWCSRLSVVHVPVDQRAEIG